jgi:hypothetical protein
MDASLSTAAYSPQRHGEHGERDSWINGMVEYWNVVKNQKKSLIIIPSLQYSITPIVRLALCAQW